jgi:KaiC/GvpD/RAD55 family RecA-like ATPase
MQIDQEIQILAKIIYDSNFRSKYLPQLRSGYFKEEMSRMQFNTIRDMHRERQGIDYENVRTVFEKKGFLMIGVNEIKTGIDYGALTDKMVKTGFMEWGQLRMAEIAKVSDPKQFEKELESFRKQISETVTQGYPVYEGEEITKKYLELRDKGVQIVGWTGVKKLDSHLGGLGAGRIHAILSAPNVGKTMFAIQTLVTTLKKGKRVLYVSTEANLFDMVSRMISRETNWSLKQVKQRDYPDNVEGKIDETIEKYRELFSENKTIISEGVTKLDDILVIMESLHYKEPLDLIIVDHVHNIRTNDRAIFDRVSRIAHELQAFAISNNVGIMLTAQMSKNDIRSDITDRTGKGGMDLEEVAENLAILDRNQFDPENRGKMTLLLKKCKDAEPIAIECSVAFPSMVINSEADLDYPQEKQEVLDLDF